ncbi:unnamed protein product [Protopolystoma xenopodis]|uniref:Uncharacterized protein n=1 Tax=Protopolystoma xenopodis TaxID=117903 RepID=A0A448WXJ7_9PLAT|nr:unnamed protein product [Protopolystoma xenopodis]
MTNKMLATRKICLHTTTSFLTQTTFDLHWTPIRTRGTRSRAPVHLSGSSKCLAVSQFAFALNSISRFPSRPIQTGASICTLIRNLRKPEASSAPLGSNRKPIPLCTDCFGPNRLEIVADHRLVESRSSSLAIQQASMHPCPIST